MFLILYRNDWVYKVRKRHNFKCYTKVQDVMKKVRNERPNNYSAILDQNDEEYAKALEEALWSYDKMLWHFWIWDVKKMINNQESYNWAYNE